MRVYLDAPPIVYLIERHSTFGPRTVQWLAANATTLVSSGLARLEALVVPARAGDQVRVQDFESFFTTRLNARIPFTRSVSDRAVGIRATTRFKTPDALHLAAAIEAGCDVFLTNDQRLTQLTGIRVELI